MKWAVAILIILLLILQYDLWVGDGSLATVWQLNKAVKEQQQENLHLRERNQSLEAEVKDLKQGQDAVEERARNELGMKKPDEIYIQVVDPDATSQQQ